MNESELRHGINPVHLILGIAVLALGVLLGYTARPFVDARLTNLLPGEPPAADPAPASPRPSDPPATLLDAVIGRTRHFKGSSDAPVTIVEFSDFQ